MSRNVLENALRFASSRIEIGIDATDTGEIRLVVRDDGPGFDSASLERFGKRHLSRSVNPIASREVTLGLGSFIMSTIARLHGGAVEAKRRGPEGGAEITIRLPSFRKPAHAAREAA